MFKNTQPNMVPWRLLCSCLVLQACLAFNVSIKDYSRRRRSLSADRECQHDGVRVDTKSGSICLCPTGYTGNTCQTEEEGTAVSMLTAMNAQNGTLMSCELNNKCIINLYLNAVNFKVNNDTVDLTGKFGQLNVMISPTSIPFGGAVSSGSGNQTYIITQGNLTFDSVTYQYEFVKKTPAASSEFLEDGNVPSDSRLVCNDFCRLLMVTRPLAANTCSQVDAPCNSAWSFPTFPSGSNCYTEIVFETDPCQKLCFAVRGTKSTLCYWRLPSYQETASCGCDTLCGKSTIEDVCCPQNRSGNVCEKLDPEPEVGGVSSAVVIGVSVGTSLSALIALVGVGCFLKFRSNLKKKIDSQSDAPGDDLEQAETQRTGVKTTLNKNGNRR